MRRFVFVVTLTALVAACAAFQGKEGKVATAGVDIALCVLAHSTEPIQNIIGICGAQNEQQVLNIFAAAQRANARGFSRPVPDAGP